jgi:hypothetical protein
MSKKEVAKNPSSNNESFNTYELGHPQDGSLGIAHHVVITVSYLK